MKIVAMYVSKHAYLYFDDALINLGGKYNYSLKNDKSPFVITRDINPQFLEDFFNVSSSSIKIENVSVIVGQNGVGKSTIFNEIRRNFIENPYALPNADSFLLIENEDDLYFYSNDNIKIHLKEKDNYIAIEKAEKDSLQTIYYSPHFDIRYDSNFGEVDYFDISTDRYFDLDLMDINSFNTNDYGLNYPIKQELLFKNALRQIFFLNCNMVKEGKFSRFFDFPIHGSATLTIREIRNEKSNRNIPFAFRLGITKIKEKIQQEQINTDSLNTIKEIKNLNGKLEVVKSRFKLNFILDLLSLLTFQMENDGTYLYEGIFNQDILKDIDRMSATDCFFYILKEFKIKTSFGEVLAFNPESLKKLVNKVFEVIENILNEENLTPVQVLVNPEDAETILELHKTVIYEISSYFSKQIDKNSTGFSGFNFLVPGFIFYSPTDRKLSSGENALLNLFSKLYDFLENKLNINLNPKVNFRTFILLLDEADAGFHPVWKKKFINVIVNTLPYFFEQYEQTPSIQIIFTTHDPLTLSDLPNANVVCLNKVEGKVIIIEQSKKLPTFGANITDLLADSFFLNDGLIGDFAHHKINDVIQWIKNPSKEDSNKYAKIIMMIDEPIVRRKLSQMFDNKMNANLELALIEREIEELQKKRQELKKND